MATAGGTQPQAVMRGLAAGAHQDSGKRGRGSSEVSAESPSGLTLFAGRPVKLRVFISPGAV